MSSAEFGKEQEELDFVLPNKLIKLVQTHPIGSSVYFHPNNTKMLLEVTQQMLTKYPHLSDPQEADKLAIRLCETPDIMETPEGKVKILIAGSLRFKSHLSK